MCNDRVHLWEPKPVEVKRRLFEGRGTYLNVDLHTGVFEWITTLLARLWTCKVCRTLKDCMCVYIYMCVCVRNRMRLRWICPARSRQLSSLVQRGWNVGKFQSAVLLENLNEIVYATILPHSVISPWASHLPCESRSERLESCMWKNIILICGNRCFNEMPTICTRGQ